MSRPFPDCMEDGNAPRIKIRRKASETDSTLSPAMQRPKVGNEEYVSALQSEGLRYAHSGSFHTSNALFEVHKRTDGPASRSSNCLRVITNNTGFHNAPCPTRRGSIVQHCDRIFIEETLCTFVVFKCNEIKQVSKSCNPGDAKCRTSRVRFQTLYCCNGGGTGFGIEVCMKLSPSCCMRELCRPWRHLEVFVHLAVTIESEGFAYRQCGQEKEPLAKL